MKLNVEEYEKLFNYGTIIDGLISPSDYFNSKYKIAWFLKEAYSNEEEGFHIKTYYGQPDRYNKFFKNVATQTWHPIIYSSYGILNDYCNWDDMPYIKNSPSMCQILDQVAIINANKEPSITGTYTTYKNLNSGFQKYKKIILKQIEVLKPQIHIFCGTFYLYKDIFALTDDDIVISSNLERCKVWHKNNKLFLDVYHPANRVQRRKNYVNEIIESVKNWTND
jgi:hypothetical protein